MPSKHGVMFKDDYRDRLPSILGQPLTSSDGLGDKAVENAVANLKFSIPQALVDSYAIAGNHHIHTTHHILRPIEESKWFGDYLILWRKAIAYTILIDCILFGLRSSERNKP